jgi:hypothetical protein
VSVAQLLDDGEHGGIGQQGRARHARSVAITENNGKALYEMVRSAQDR